MAGLLAKRSMQVACQAQHQPRPAPLLPAAVGRPVTRPGPSPSAAQPTSLGSTAGPSPFRPSDETGTSNLQRIHSTAMTADGGKEKEKKSGSNKKLLVLGSLFGAWYLANIYFNIFNKQALKAFPNPLILTTVQFMVGACIVLVSWITGIVKRPVITLSMVQQILPLAVVHTMGNLLTNMSLGAVAVSFTHTIKAMEPFFSVALSSLFLGDPPSGSVLLTLLPIVGGVALASMTEASFNWMGFVTAMLSNLTFQSRNVLSKKLMGGKKPLDNINLFSLITLLSAVILVPITLLLEGWTMTPSHLQAMGVTDVNGLFFRAIMSGVMFHTYQQVSYMILSRVTAITHSIGNCVKRVVVIIASVFVFQNPTSLQNAMGTSLALAGVFAYSQVKRAEKQQKKASKSE